MFAFANYCKLSIVNVYSQSTAKHGNLEAVRELLSLGAPHRPRESFGELPIDFAKEFGYPDVEKYLGIASGTQFMNKGLISDLFHQTDEYVPPQPTVYKYQWYGKLISLNCLLMFQCMLRTGITAHWTGLNRTKFSKNMPQS